MDVRIRTALAIVVGLATWAGCSWIASRFIELPAGVFAFWGILFGVVLLLGFIPLHGFHWDSLKTGVAIVLALWVALVVMATPWLTFLIGMLVVGLCFSPGAVVAGLLLEDEERTEPEDG
jgi:hypothetical protein